MVDTTDIEKKSLEAHVELCAERYRALELQLDAMIVCIDEIKSDVKVVHGMVHRMSEQRNNQLINWGIGVIGALTATVGWLLTHYVFK
jgi:putative Mn2+ efflux pump MntP